MGALAHEGMALKDTEKITIGICSPGYVVTDFLTSLLDVARSQKQLGQFISLQGSGVISRLRNQVAATFLDATKDDWLLMIDSDEQLDVLTFDRLCETAHDKERPVVAGLVFAGFGVVGKPYPKPVPAIFQDTENGFLPLYKYDKNAVFEIDAAGTGCLMIHRSVLEAMREASDPNQGKDWCWFWDGPIKGEWIGEDLLFCRRIKSLGFPIYVNTAAILPHSKSFWLKEEHHELWRD